MSESTFLLLQSSVRRRRRISLAPVHLPDLGIRGIYFSSGGERWTAIQCSQFALYGRYLAGEDISGVLTQCRDTGFNLLRVWTLYDVDGIGHLVPAEHPDFYQRLPAFLGLCAAYGLYVELTVFTGTSRLLPARNQQQAHLDGVAAAIRTWQPHGVLMEGGNEYDQGDNAWRPDLSWPIGLLMSSGSVGADTWPIERGLPIFGYEEYHSNDVAEWSRKVGHEPMEMSVAHGVPCLANENTRFPDRCQSTQMAFDAGASAALLCAGSCFHSSSGKLSVLWAGIELDCARAWAAGARSVPLLYQDGAYVHRADLETSSDLRVYQRQLPGGAAFTVEVRK